MDVVKFIEERDRMCHFYHNAGDCYQCPAKGCECSSLEGMVDNDNIVAIVEEWSAAHPRKTRQSVFLEQYPDAFVAPNGVLTICPANISSSSIYRGEHRRCLTANYPCPECRREFWMQEVE